MAGTRPTRTRPKLRQQLTRAQDCLSLYLQGAGAQGPGSTGKDGKEKLDTDLRMFCEQVVDATLINKCVNPCCHDIKLTLQARSHVGRGSAGHVQGHCRVYPDRVCRGL